MEQAGKDKQEILNCVDKALVNMLVYIDILELLEYNVSETYRSREKVSENARKQLGCLSSLGCILVEGFRNIIKDLETVFE